MKLNTFIFIILLSMLILIGCGRRSHGIIVDPNDFLEPITIWETENDTLVEGSYSRMPNPYSTLVEGSFSVKINVTNWPGHYGLEVIIFGTDQFIKYENDENYSAWQYTLNSTGCIQFRTTAIPVGKAYYILVDNSDRGWELTDDDSVVDIAVYNIHAAFVAASIDDDSKMVAIGPLAEEPFALVSRQGRIK